MKVAYSQTDDEGATVPGLGNGADWTYVGHIFTGSSYASDAKGLMFEAGYNFGKVGVDGLSGVVAYSMWDDVGSDMVLCNGGTCEVDELYFKLAYKFTGELKGLSGSAEYADNGKDYDKSEFRLKLKYAFAE